MERSQGLTGDMDVVNCRLQKPLPRELNWASGSITSISHRESGRSEFRWYVSNRLNADISGVF